MRILAFDLSSARGSIAFGEATGAQLFAAEFPNDRKHSGAFFAQLQQCLREHGQPDRTAVGLGPGSYAGSRIAISAALGLRAGSEGELIGIASVRAIRANAADYCVIGDARRGFFYFARVHERRCTEGPLLCSRDELQTRLSRNHTAVFAMEPMAGFRDVEVAYPAAAILLQIAISEPTAAATAPLEPIYLRAAHITRAKPVFAGRGE